MKSILTLIVLLAALLRAGAQISVEVQFEQDQFLPNEALMAKVRVVNFSGQTRPGGGEPELRRYALLQAAYLKQLTLYARVSDVNEVRVFKVYPIGPMVSFSKPEGQVDKTSNLHVLWQVGARSFQYVVVSPEGE